MTELELARRDLRKAHKAHSNACAKPNVPAAELVQTLELVVLRTRIVEILEERESYGSSEKVR